MCHTFSVAFGFNLNLVMSGDDGDFDNFSMEDPCVFLPFEESVRLTDSQTIYRGEFAPSVDPPRPSAPLMVLLPVAAARVRLVAFDIVIDCHEDSDIEVCS